MLLKSSLIFYISFCTLVQGTIENNDYRIVRAPSTATRRANQPVVVKYDTKLKKTKHASQKMRSPQINPLILFMALMAQQQQQQAQQQQNGGHPYIIIVNPTNRNDHDHFDSNKNNNNPNVNNNNDNNNLDNNNNAAQNNNNNNDNNNNDNNDNNNNNNMQQQQTSSNNNNNNNRTRTLTRVSTVNDEEPLRLTGNQALTRITEIIRTGNNKNKVYTTQFTGRGDEQMSADDPNVEVYQIDADIDSLENDDTNYQQFIQPFLNIKGQNYNPNYKVVNIS